MCGRYVQTKRARARAEQLARVDEARAPRGETWNLAPSTLSLVVRQPDTAPSADWLTWGLEGAHTSGLRPINAKLASVRDKPLFREAWKSRRCVVPADGWYEWREERGRKQPYYFARRDGVPIFFAGLWSGETFCLLTTATDGDLAKIHDRRPLSLRDEDAASWLAEVPSTPEKVAFCAVPAVEIAFHPVAARVGSPRHDGPDLITPVEIAPEEGLLPGF